jgi:hypothetical protein
VVALVLLCGGLYMMKNKRSIIEGLANPAHTEFVSKGLSNDITSLQDALHISKYQSNYQSIVKDMMQWCDLSILKVLVSNKIGIEDGVDTANTELITSLNQYAQFKNTLQGVNDTLLTNVQSSVTNN